MTQSYTELHLHSYYSLLDGFNSPEEYIKRAAELGMTHMALTDHGVLSGHREFQKHAKNAGVTPILGCEMYISETDRFDRRAVTKRDDNTQAYNHLIVLAQNENGLKNLNRLSEVAWNEGFYSKPRIDMEILGEHSEDLIVLSGCLNGLIAKAIENNNLELAEARTREFKATFGERFFMELQQHNPKKINDGLIALAKKHKIRPVLTSDCHYARKEDLWLEEAMLIISTKPNQNKNFDFSKSQKMEMIERFNYAYPMFVLDADGNPVLDKETQEPVPTKRMSFQNFDLFLHAAQDHQSGPMARRYGQEFVDECLENTMVVSKMIGDYPFHEALDLLPKPKGEDPDALLEKKAWAGLRKRGLDSSTEHVNRLREELDIIKAKNFSTYFLIEANGVNWGRNQGIMFGPGRGSGAGSFLNYCLWITNVDPIEHNLLFFRFINPERNDFPDIDTDVEDSRRSEIKAYYARQFKHVASIATFGTFASKNSVRDAARVFLVPLPEVNKALKGADWPANMDFFEQWDNTENGKTFKRKYPEVVRLAKELQGRVRSQGMHAGGLIVSSEPISNYAPIQTSKDASDEAGTRIPVVALDMNQAAEVGFIKYDYLGLKALTILSDTLSMIKSRHGIDIDLDNLSLDDPKVFKSLSAGWTKGVFQCEAAPYTNLLILMGGVKTFNDLVASNALVRPGAMKSTAGAAYIARNKGEEMITYHHPVMQPFTKDTYGVVIYQEQVMLAMTELAGMSMATADKVRKIIGKKRDVSEFEIYKTQFVDGASEKIPRELAEQLWHDFEAHAGYSFNKSHAVAYSMLSYWTAWLKLYYPLEFMTAVLRNEKDKDQLLDYLTEAKRLGLKIMLPHVNESGIKFEIQGESGQEYIRFGLSNVKYISGKVGAKLLENRPFRNYNELYEKAMEKNSGLSTRTLHALNSIGAAAFPDNPRRGDERNFFFEYLNIPAFEIKSVPPRMKAQFRPLSEFSDAEVFVCMGMVRGIKTGPGWARIDAVDETGSAGVFTDEHHQIESGQMYIFLVSNNRIVRYVNVRELDDLVGKDHFVDYLLAESLPTVVPGLHKVVSFSSRVTKAGKKMADVVLSDGQKNLSSALAFPQNFMRVYSRMPAGAVVDVNLGFTKEGTAFIDEIKERYE